MNYPKARRRWRRCVADDCHGTCHYDSSGRAWRCQRCEAVYPAAKTGRYRRPGR